MTTELEHRLAESMATQVGGVAFDPAVLTAAKRRHARRTALIRTVYATAAVAALGITAVTFYPAGAKSPVPAVAQSPDLSPSMQLAAAAAASDNLSYQLKLTIQWDRPSLPTRPVTLSGAFDPTSVTGYLHSTDGLVDERLVAGTRYSRATSDPSAPFVQWEKPKQALQFTQVLGEAGLTLATPADLARSLEQANAVITQNPGGGFHYRFSKPGRAPQLPSSVHEGDITVDGEGRIAKITCLIVAPEPDGVAKGDFTIEISGYGSTVTVERPANVVVMEE